MIVKTQNGDLWVSARTACPITIHKSKWVSCHPSCVETNKSVILAQLHKNTPKLPAIRRPHHNSFTRTRHYVVFVHALDVPFRRKTV
jgi:hypothetical protein